MSETAGLRYALRNEVAIEDFGERSLVLRCDALDMREVNAAGRKILALLDGERAVADIAGAAALANHF